MKEETTIKEVFVNITTIPKLDKIEPGDTTFTRFKSTYSDHKEYLNDKQVIQSYFNDAGKSVAFCKVLQISMGFVNKGIVRVKVLTGEEGNIIKEFHNELKSDFFKEAKLYGYNNKFIFDVLQFRARKNKIRREYEAPQFKDIKLSPWKQTKSICLMNEIVSGYGKISLLNAMHGAELSLEGIIPSENIYECYESGEIESIINSNAHSIKGLVNINNFLEVEDFITEIALKVTEVKEVEKQTIALITYIKDSGNLTDEHIELLKGFVEEDKLNKEETITIITAALSKTVEKGLNNHPQLQKLRDALLGKIDSTGIECVIEAKSLGKKHAPELVKLHGEKSREERQEVYDRIEKYLKDNNKIQQPRVQNAINHLRVEFKLE